MIFSIFSLSADPAKAAPPVQIQVFGQPLQSDVAPMIVQGRTMVPIRVIGNALKAHVDWDQNSRTAIVQYGGKNILLTHGAKYYILDGKVNPLDVNVQLVQGRVLVPLRVVSESFGYKVGWNPATYVVTINSDATTNPAETFTAKQGVAVIQKDGTAIYDKDSLASAKLMVSNKNTRYDITAASAHWFKINLPDGRSGFVQQSDVSLLGEPISEQALSPYQISKVSGYLEVVEEVVNLRNGPGLTYDKISTVTRGQRLTILGKAQGWYQVKTASQQTLWIFGELVREVDSLTTTSSSSTGDIEIKESNDVRFVSNNTAVAGQSTLSFDIGNSDVKVVEEKKGYVKFVIEHARLTAQSAPGNPPSPFTAFQMLQSDPETVTVIANTAPDNYFRVDHINQRFAVTAVAKHKNGHTGLAGKTIVISPGHGNYSNGTVDPGAIGTTYGTSEVQFNTPVALKLKQKLEMAGAKVIMTRPSLAPVHLTLKQRADIANNNHADAFVEIHGDSAPSNPAARGIGIYLYDGPLRLTSAAQKSMRHQFANDMRTGLMAATGATTSVRVANFAVTRENEVPSVLIECGFLSNPAEEALLRSDAYQEKLSKGMFDGLSRYFSY